MKPILGMIIAERYRIVESIGSGGAGNVYRAVHIQLNREVALKLVRTDVEPDVRQELGARFRREASMAARLSHPNIVTVHDFGLTEDGLQYVVMALLKGRCLKKVMKEQPMAGQEAARIGAALARGLRHAHGNGLVHRDVKPTNVLLVEDDDDIEQPLLLDFGLVKSSEADLEMTGKSSYLGTPLYMSPEQVRRGGEVDHRTDIYALGCMLYGMVAGVMPYRADGALATAMMHIEEPYPLMAQKAPDRVVAEGLEAIVRRCMEKDPADRFQDAGELAVALDAWRVDSQTPVNKRPRRWVVPFLGGASFLGTMGIGIGLMGFASLCIALYASWSASTVETLPTFVLSGQPIVDPPPVVIESPSPPPKPVVVKKPKPKPRLKPVIVDDVKFEGRAAVKALKWVNTASWKELSRAGIYPKGCSILTERRPFKSLSDVGALKGIGTKTMEAIERAQR